MSRPAESYRSYRRANARKQRLMWRQLPKVRDPKTAQAVVIVPAKA